LQVLPDPGDDSGQDPAPEAPMHSDHGQGESMVPVRLLSFDRQPFRQWLAPAIPRRSWRSASLLLLLGGLAGGSSIPAYGRYSDGAGIESVTSESIHRLTISRVIFEGPCPGEALQTITGYFVNDDLPPQPGLSLKLTNLSRGLSPNSPPYTIRAYDYGRTSESFDIILGEKHRGRYFVVRRGRNFMQYDILQAGNVVASGSFTVDVDVPIFYRYRGRKAVEVTKYNSDGKSYRVNEYRCP